MWRGCLEGPQRTGFGVGATEFQCLASALGWGLFLLGGSSSERGLGLWPPPWGGVGRAGVLVVPHCVKDGALSPSSANTALRPGASLGRGAWVIVHWQYCQREAFPVRHSQLSAAHMYVKC